MCGTNRIRDRFRKRDSKSLFKKGKPFVFTFLKDVIEKIKRNPMV